MRPISSFEHLMSSSVLVAARTSTDKYGKPTFGTAVRYTAHLSRKRRMVRSLTGQEVVSEQALYLSSADNIQPSAKVTLSTGDVGSTEAAQISPPIIAVDRRFDEAGAHSVTLYL